MPKIKGTLENPGLPEATEITPETVFVGSIDDSPEGTKQYSFALMQEFITNTSDIYSIAIKRSLFDINIAELNLTKFSSEENSRLRNVLLSALTTIDEEVYVYANSNFLNFSAPLLETVGVGKNRGITFDNSRLLETVNLPLLTAVGSNFRIENSDLLNTLNIPKLETIPGTLAIVRAYILTAINLPALLVVNGQINSSNNSLATTFLAPLLHTVAQDISIHSNPLLQTLNLGGLTSHKQIFLQGLPNLVNLNLGNNNNGDGSYFIQIMTCGISSLVISNRTTNGFFGSIVNNPNLTSINFTGSKISANGSINISDNTLLTSIILGIVEASSYQSQYNFDDNALSQTSVDHILAKYATLNVPLTAALNLQGGTNATPSSAGLTSKATLQGLGWTVNHN